MEQLRGLKGRRDPATELRRIISMLEGVISNLPIKGPVRSDVATLDVWRITGSAYHMLSKYDPTAKAKALRYMRQYIVVERRETHNMFIEEIKGVIKELSAK